MLGKKLGNRYEILALIGSGGMSRVYQAKDTYLGRIVAVKVLREQFVSDEDFIRRFRREAQSAASLSHLNIVNIYDVGQDGPNHYLVMEMVRGKTLKEYIKEQGFLPIEEAMLIAKQICDALEHAHENSIIHRDIKPHNILLTAGNRVKVTDFGIARAISSATVTHTKSIIGSVHYFSPEQAKGEIAGVKSDIYSLGIVLYEMLTGRLPFEGDSPIGIALKHIQGEAVKPSVYNTEISPYLERIILKAIAKDPADRYGSIRKFRLDLMEVLLKEPITNIAPIEKKGKKISYEESNEVSEDTLVIEKDLVLAAELAPRPLKPFLKPMIVIFVLAIFFGGIFIFGDFFVKSETKVPNLLNLPADEAQRLLKNNNLKMEITRYVFHPEIAKEHVVHQAPAADAVVKVGRVIDVILSNGPEIVLVPNLIGSPRLIAEVNIENAGLIVGRVDEITNEDLPKGQVINQFPDPFEEVIEKTKVDLVISKGPEPKIIPMPDLYGQDFQKVEEILSEAFLTVGDLLKEASSLFPKGFVVGQSIGKGQDVLQGNTVDLIISDGPGPQAKEEKLNLKVNQAGQIKIEVQDIRGERLVYENYHQQGDSFSTTIKYYGQAVIVVYRDGTIVSKKTISAD